MYCNEFSQIPAALTANPSLRTRIAALIASEPILGKALEGPSREAAFRSILHALVNGSLSIREAIEQTELQLSRNNSVHRFDNRVFASGWAERLVRTQLSRFYNQGVLMLLAEDGVETCFIPHSSEEKGDSPCTVSLAGRHHSVSDILSHTHRAYAMADYDADLKMPNHPHCTHVVKPI